MGMSAAHEYAWWLVGWYFCLLEARALPRSSAPSKTGCEAIDKAKKLRPHLIVLDLAMPVLNGIEASRVLKRLMPTTPIVMFTSFTDTHIKKAALAAGPDAFVDKFEADVALISSIEQLLVPGPPPSTDEAA
jgi:CheY-like chemotaxis protein